MFARLRRLCHMLVSVMWVYMRGGAHACASGAKCMFARLRSLCTVGTQTAFAKKAKVVCMRVAIRCGVSSVCSRCWYSSSVGRSGEEHS